MPQHHLHIPLGDDDERLLRRVQQRLCLPTLDAAAEWLLKARLRRMGRNATQRGRAMYPQRTAPGAQA